MSTARTRSSEASPEYLTQIQICRKLGISDETWRRWRAARLTPEPARLPGRLRWHLEDIERFERGNTRFFTSHRRAPRVRPLTGTRPSVQPMKEASPRTTESSREPLQFPVRGER